MPPLYHQCYLGDDERFGKTRLRWAIFIPGGQNNRCKSQRRGRARERRFLRGMQQEGQCEQQGDSRASTAS